MIFLFTLPFYSSAQKLYSAEGYQAEQNNGTYQKILKKKQSGESLSVEESLYLEDYEQYLAIYYNRMSEEEKFRYSKQTFNAAAEIKANDNEDFSLRTKDRLVNGIYGAYYGASLMVIMEVDNAGVAIGVPLIMAGLWQLGPVINPKKYENISLATVRAGNTGKLLGLGYGAALGLALGGDSESTGKLAMGLSTAGSIILGEAAFHMQKKNDLSGGHIEMIRHYGFLGPIVGGLGAVAIDYENPNLAGASIFAGGIVGILIGNKVAKNYDYTVGDVDVINSITLISAGLGTTFAVGSLDTDSNLGLFLIPAATAIGGTIFGQKSVKGVRVTRRQGSTINLSSGGAALIGLGIVALTESDLPAVYIGVSSGMALIMHQILFQSYKKKNLMNELNFGKADTKSSVQFSVKVTPENYFVNQQLTEEQFYRNPELTFPIVKLKLVF